MIPTEFITQSPRTDDRWDIITTLVDRLSRRVHFVPSKITYTAQDTSKFFFKVTLPQHGIPDAIISYRDSKFISKYWKELISMCGVKLIMASARHPQTDVTFEVIYRVVKSYLRCFCKHKQDNWDILLPSAELAYKSAVSEDSGTSPFEVDLRLGRRDPLDIITGKTTIQAVEEFKEELQGAFEDEKYTYTLANPDRLHS